jgi:hypothetical protein
MMANIPVLTMHELRFVEVCHRDQAIAAKSNVASID